MERGKLAVPIDDSGDKRDLTCHSMPRKIFCLIFLFSMIEITSNREDVPTWKLHVIILFCEPSSRGSFAGILISCCTCIYCVCTYQAPAPAFLYGAACAIRRNRYIPSAKEASVRDIRERRNLERSACPCGGDAYFTNVLAGSGRHCGECRSIYVISVPCQ